MYKQPNAVRAMVLIAAMVVLLGAGCATQTKTSERSTQPPPSPEASAPSAAEVQDKSEVKEAAPAHDVTGVWNYGSKISGNQKSGTMTFKGSEVMFDMLAARYTISGDDISFSVYGGFTYSGRITAPDYMSGNVTQNGQGVGTWDAKRPGAGGAEAAAPGQPIATEESGYDITGNWEFDGASMAKEIKTVYLLEGDAASGVFTNGDSSTGRYSLTGNDVKWVFAGGTEYVGTVTDSDHMSGKTQFNGAQIGTWSARKKSDVLYDIRDSWNFSTTSKIPVGSKPVTIEVIMGYMNSPSSVPPSMTAGKVARASDGERFFDYKVDWPGGSVTFTTWNGSITYTGTFVNANLMRGEYKGVGLSSDAAGTWSAERIED